MSNKKTNASQLKKFRSEIAELKKKGLVGKKVDARTQKETRYMKSQIKKYRDVLEGNAKVISVPKRANAKQFSEQFRTKGNKVVIPVSDKSEKVRYNKKTEQIIGVSKRADKERVHYYGNPEKVKPRKGKQVVYRIRFQSVGTQTFDDYGNLVAFMEPYETGRSPWHNWRDYIEIIEEDDDEGDEE